MSLLPRLLPYHMKSNLLPTKPPLFHTFVSQKGLMQYKFDITKHSGIEQEIRLTSQQEVKLGAVKHPSRATSFHPSTQPFPPFPLVVRMSLLASGSLHLPGEPVFSQGFSQSLSCIFHSPCLSPDISRCYYWLSADGWKETEIHSWDHPRPS